MPGRSSRRNRDVGGQRESSGSSTRSHRHSHRSSTRSRRFNLKHKERNFIAAVCSMVVIVILCTALAETKWISMRGGGCNVNHIGAYQFFYSGFFETSHYKNEKTPASSSNNIPSSDLIYNYGAGRIMKNCVNSKVVALMKVIITFVFFAIICSFCAFLLDLLGPLRRSLKMIRRNAMLSIITVVICVVINGFTYWITTEVERLQLGSKVKKGSKVEVNFDISFYLVAAAGGVAVIATACNCLRQYPVYEESQSETLLDDYDGASSLLPPGPDASALSQMPAPPAYTP